MTANQFRAALDKLGLSQVGAARILGVNDVTVRRWAKGGVGGIVVIVIRAMIAGKLTVKDVERFRE